MKPSERHARPSSSASESLRAGSPRFKVAGVADGTVTLVAPSPFHATRIINEYEMPLLDAWRAMDQSIQRIAALASTPGIARI
jgi:hypothetical protein